MWNRFWIVLAALLVTILVGSVPSIAADESATGNLFTIRIGQQPQRWSVEWYIASKKGWWKEVDLKPVMSTFASGAVEIAAGASGSWDIGAAGDIPSALGAARYGLQTIGIADSEAAINTIMASKDKAEEYLKNPKLIKGKIIPVTTNSTGQWAATECLAKKFGLKPSDYRFVNLSPAAINAAVKSGRYDISEVWAPNTYILESSMGAKVICNGAEVHLPITSNLFVFPAFAKKHPEIVAKWLAVYLRAVAWEKTHPKETVQYLGEFFKSVGVNIPEKYLPQELHDRPAYTLAGQLKIFQNDPTGESEVIQWWNQLGKFMVSVGMVTTIPDPHKYVTDKYLLMIQNDPKLKAFAENSSN